MTHVARSAAIDEAAGAIGAALREAFHCGPTDLLVTWKLDLDGHVELQVSARGFGSVATSHPDFDATLTRLRDEHIDVLDAERWAATVGERALLAEMPEDVFAARMRGKVVK